MFQSEVYVNRRRSLLAQMASRGAQGIAVFLGNVDAATNYRGNDYKFRQDSNFLYFWGVAEPWFAAVLDLDSGAECLYGNDVDIDDIIWMGPQPSIKDLAAQVGVHKSMPLGKLKDVVAQAIAQIALGFSQATTAAAGGGPFAWIAAIAGGLATMTSTIAAIHSATGYAKGGKVEGPAGIDNVPAWLTAGEIVLNAMQQKNVAQAIMSGNDGGGDAVGGIPYVTGETIVLGMNNHLKRSGQGEIVTTGMLKRMKLL